MNVLHVIRQVSDGGATLGMLQACTAPIADVRHEIASLLPARPEGLVLCERSGVNVISGVRGIASAVESADVLQLEWWNNPHLNDFVMNARLAPSRMLLHSRGHFDAPWMCPTAALLSRVDYCTVTTPSAAANRFFETNRRAAGLPPADCVFSAASRPFVPKRMADGGLVIFGYLGTVEPIKMHSAALEIAARVIRAAPEAIFTFAGDGPLDEYRAQARRLGVADRVRFVGFQDPDAFLSGIDVFFYPLNPFTYATSEKALQEAMFASLPCVAFPYGGIRDLLTPDCAMLVDSVDECIDACLSLAQSAEQRTLLGQRALARIEELPQLLRWQETLAAVWSRVASVPRRFRAPLHVRPEELFDCCTERRASRRDEIGDASLADFDAVAAFVEDDYAAWLTSAHSEVGG
jgi:glycosyltransferase involved in cell wall biosynthesis